MPVSRPQCACHQHVGDERGPCHVGHHHPTRCHDLNGQGVKQWFAGRTEAQGLDVCDAYACKKKAGLEVEGAARRGLDPVRKKQEAEGGDLATSYISCMADVSIMRAIQDCSGLFWSRTSGVG